MNDDNFDGLLTGDILDMYDVKPENHLEDELAFCSNQTYGELVFEADRLGIPEEDLLKAFMDPLPPRDDEAKLELKSRLLALFATPEDLSQNMFTSLIYAYRCLNKLREMDSKIRRVIPKLARYFNNLKRFDKFALPAQYAELEHIQYQINFFQSDVTERIEAFDESEIGKKLKKRMKKPEAIPLDQDELNEALAPFKEMYKIWKPKAERLIYSDFPWILKKLKEITTFKRSIKLLEQLPKNSWKIDEDNSLFTEDEISELKEKHNKFPEEWLLEQLDRLGRRKYCNISRLASLVSKSGKQVSPQAELKAVKRKFRGLLPAGVEGEDYKVVKAKKSHVLDGTARQIGDPVFAYIQGRTRFETERVINYLEMKLMLTLVMEQLLDELGHKPSPDEIASEMDLPVGAIWPLLD